METYKPRIRGRGRDIAAEVKEDYTCACFLCWLQLPCLEQESYSTTDDNANANDNDNDVLKCGTAYLVQEKSFDNILMLPRENGKATFVRTEEARLDDEGPHRFASPLVNDVYGSRQLFSQFQSY